MTVGVAVFVLSFSALGYEVLLMKLLSISQWHHFAYMIISIALLGYGASGTFLTFLERSKRISPLSIFVGSGVLFSLSVVVCFALSQRVPLNPLEILWDPSQWVHLFRVFLILFFPFLFAATFIGMAFIRFKGRIHSIYLWDLLGAGTGALAMVPLLFAFPATEVLKVFSGGGLLAAGLLLGAEKNGKRRSSLVLIACAVALPFLWPSSMLQPNISPYKGIQGALNLPGARIVHERHGPLGWLAVVESPKVPFRHAPGQSLNCTVEPPQQVAVFTNGDGLSPITRFEGDRATLAYLDCVTWAAPYHLLEHPRVLVLGAGGGTDVLMALYHEARAVDAVEFDANVVSLVREEFGAFSGHLYDNPRVTVHVEEARGFVAGRRDRYDLIQVSLLDSFSASAAGSHALAESYLYTVEALKEYFQHLEPSGILAITRWLKIPPRDALKLFVSMVEALEGLEISRPGDHLVLIRSWSTTTLLIKRSPFTGEEVKRVLDFCRERSFDVDFHPAIQPHEVNRFNLLEEPFLYEGTAALLGSERRSFMDQYKFYIEPATDDRPYFFHFFKWRILREAWDARGRGGLALMEWTYPILLITLGQAALASLILIVLPLLARRIPSRGELPRWRLILYFGSLGLAFLFVEIAFIQKFILFLSHPIYTVSVVLSGFLVFAGLGSRASGWMKEAWHERYGPLHGGAFITAAIIGLTTVSLVYLWILPEVFRVFLGSSNVLKILVSLALIAPQAFLMGMPFPLGLSIVARHAPQWIPWAWGINGCASVVSAVLATILAVHFGFSVVIWIALCLYAAAAACFWGSMTLDP